MFLLNIKSEPLQYSIIIYLLSLTIFNILKPDISYINGEIKQFGIGDNKTMFPFPILSLIVSIFIYLFLTVYLN